MHHLVAQDMELVIFFNKEKSSKAKAHLHISASEVFQGSRQFVFCIYFCYTLLGISLLTLERNTNGLFSGSKKKRKKEKKKKKEKTKKISCCEDAAQSRHLTMVLTKIIPLKKKRNNVQKYFFQKQTVKLRFYCSPVDWLLLTLQP